MLWSPRLGVTTMAAIVVMSAPPTSDPSHHLPDVTDIAAAGALSVPIAGTPSWALVSGGFAWVATEAGVLRLDGTSGETLGTTSVSGEVCNGMGRGLDSVWVGTCGGDPTITRIDDATGDVIAHIPLGTPTGLRDNSSVSFGEGSVWALTSGNDPLLVQIDPQTNAVTNRYPVAVGSAAVQAGEGAVWVTNCQEEILLRIDPATGRRVASVDVGYYPDALTIGEGSIWVMNEEDGSVSRVDPTTNTTIATIEVSPDGIDGDIVVAGGYVWARVNDELLAQIDPATNEVVARFGPPAGHGSVAADDAAVWVTGEEPASVWRLALPVPE